ncbi:hypothetical protein ElyMa_003271300 [Elysia marginata]|uniref:Uncharacterized protein n=1 Tax=Elysia marginata TaxID=1093978 RepID=A0AAV4J7M1_9GAST|nr:hypothetical protein ElyMa_003271300 [Elysia marginata]
MPQQPAGTSINVSDTRSGAHNINKSPDRPVVHGIFDRSPNVPNYRSLPGVLSIEEFYTSYTSKNRQHLQAQAPKHRIDRTLQLKINTERLDF